MCHAMYWPHICADTEDKAMKSIVAGCYRQFNLIAVFIEIGETCALTMSANSLFFNQPGDRNRSRKSVLELSFALWL